MMTKLLVVMENQGILGLMVIILFIHETNYLFLHTMALSQVVITIFLEKLVGSCSH